MSTGNVFEECCWWLKARITSEELVQQERSKIRFDSTIKPKLLNGDVFKWKQSNAPASTAGVFLSTALTSLSKLSGTELAPKTSLSTSSVDVLLKLRLPEKKEEGAPASAVVTKITEMVYQDENATSLAWASLELAKNQPKYSGCVPLHKVQTVKERDGCLVVSDHENNVLFEGKSENAKAWVAMILEALKVLAPQIEDEGAAVRGVYYRSQQLERLEARKQEREERKRQLGPVTMAHTARAMMKQEA